MVSHPPKRTPREDESALPQRHRNRVPEASSSYESSPELLLSPVNISISGPARKQAGIAPKSPYGRPEAATEAKTGAVTPAIALVHRSANQPVTAAADIEFDGTQVTAPYRGSASRKAQQPGHSGQAVPPGRPAGSAVPAPPSEEQQALITDLVDKALRRFMRNQEVDRERRRMRP